ncbi:MAG TPA: RloB family protein [Pirellulales bacterium]|nr:RloB family protein [Pirellulales bacterium]
MRKRDRDRRPARAPAPRKPKPRILVVCEGEITEKEYIEGFAFANRNRLVDVEVEPGSGTPLTIVRTARRLRRLAEARAKRERDVNLRYNQVWCVFDVDEHPHLADARQTALDNKFRLAISHPCVELWLYLHFADQPGPQTRQDMLRRLKEHVPDFDKHVDYRDYAAGYEQAVKRAEKLETAAVDASEPDRNPTTGFWRLTESIRKGS